MSLSARIAVLFFVAFAMFVSEVIGKRSLKTDLSSGTEIRQLKTIETMLKNYKAKLMKSPSSRINANGPSVWIGASPPDDPEFLAKPHVAKNVTIDPYQRKHHRLVRSRYQPHSEEVCKTNRYWKQINETHDIYGQEVRIVHTPEFRQFAFVYECIAGGEPCLGIVDRYQSSCEMRSGWANMLHLKSSSMDAAPHWGYVSVPHHCACRVYPRVNPFA